MLIPAILISVAIGAAIFAIWRAPARLSAALQGNAPRIVPNDVEEAVARIARRSIENENRLIALEHRETEREASLADALQRYERMTKRLTMRADRAGRPEETGDLSAIIARRNGIR